MQRKSICFITHELIVGGIESVLTEALKVLHTKYDIEVISLFNGVDKALLDAFPSDVNVRCGPFLKNNIIDRIINRLKGKPYLSRFYFNKVINRRFDYIISLKSLERFACFSNKGTYKIYWCHNDFYTKFMTSPLSKSSKKEKNIVKRLFKKHTMIWTVNGIIANDLKAIFPSENFYALPNPIDCNAILKKATEPCDTVFSKHEINIVLLGRISSEKGFGRVVGIMSQGLFERFKNAHIYIIGGGVHEQAFKKKLAALGLSNRVTLLGSKSNPYPYLKQADLLICPSKYKSFGLVMLEAMLLNVPIIATATTGAKYVTQNGKYACCVENNDESLRKAIEHFLDKPDSYHYSQEEIQKWVWKHDISVFKERLLELLEKCENKNL